MSYDLRSPRKDADMSRLTELLEPISRRVPELDLSDRSAAERALNEEFPPDSEAIREIATAAFDALRAGEICGRGEPDMRWGRVAKPEETPGGCSIDAVHMRDSSGPAHAHPNGEVCLCLPEGAGAAFEDRPDTWIVMPAG